MKRIYSNYPEYEYDGIAEEAEKRGLSLSAFQRYCVMVFMADNTLEFNYLQGGYYGDISYRLNRFKRGETFTVADLFGEEWDGFDKSQKMMMAKRLVKFAKNNPYTCSVYQSEPGKTTLYIKKSSY